MQLTRRKLFAGAAAVALAPAVSIKPAFAAAPAAGMQGPSFYRYKVGSYECTQASDGIAQFPMPDGFIKNASKEEVSKALQEGYLPGDKMTVPFNPMAVNTGSKLIVIDTGYSDKGPKTAGQFHKNLGAAGIDLKAVDIVVISHFHPDHINGLVDASGASAFPNAEVKVPEPEAAFWMDDATMGMAQGPRLAAFQNVRRVMGVVNKQITKYQMNKEVAPGITAIATPGHTPGHTSFVVASGNGKLLVQSDVTNNPYLFLRHPNWHVTYDMDGTK
ncbi:MAG: MBL fold metallo-hydrolase, partial [Deltaproteobacteria bacterium]|nr:MBL fold metallo-hydrolase [Deltaproteobacteria bacterium]